MGGTGAKEKPPAAALFQPGDRVRFVHGRETDEINGGNLDYTVKGFHPNNLVEISPADGQGVSCTIIPAHLYLIKDHGLNNGDLVTVPTKLNRREKQENFPKPPELWVIVDASSSDEIAITRYSSSFDGLEDFTRSPAVSWSWRKTHEVKRIGLDIFQQRDRTTKAAEKLRERHDLELQPTNSRYTDDSPILEKLIGEAASIFNSQPEWSADFAGYLQKLKVWEVAVFDEDGKPVGSLFFERSRAETLDTADPHGNLEWLGEYEGFWWRPDENLEAELYERDLIIDLERLAQRLLEQPTPIVKSLMESAIATLTKNGYQAQTAGYTYNRGGAWRVEVLGNGLSSENAYYLRFETEDDEVAETEYLGCYQACWWRTEWGLNRYLQQNDPDTLQDLKAIATKPKSEPDPFANGDDWLLVINHSKGEERYEYENNRYHGQKYTCEYENNQYHGQKYTCDLDSENSPGVDANNQTLAFSLA